MKRLLVFIAILLLATVPATAQEADLTTHELPDGDPDFTLTVTGNYAVIGDVITLAPSFSHDFDGGNPSAALAARFTAEWLHVQAGVTYAKPDAGDKEEEQGMESEPDPKWGLSPILSVRARLLGPLGVVGYVRDPLRDRQFSVGASLQL